MPWLHLFMIWHIINHDTSKLYCYIRQTTKKLTFLFLTFSFLHNPRKIYCITLFTFSKTKVYENTTIISYSIQLNKKIQVDFNSFLIVHGQNVFLWYCMCFTWFGISLQNVTLKTRDIIKDIRDIINMLMSNTCVHRNTILEV